MESHGQENEGALTPPGKKIQPHQIALWLAIGFVVLSFLSPYLLGGQFMAYGSYLAWPGMWCVRHFRLTGGSEVVVMILWGVLAAYFMFYIPVKLWMTSTRYMRITLTAYVALCFGTYEFYQWYSTRTDWVSHGLNPDRAGFEPQVVVLSGEFDYWYKEFGVKSGRAFFEIRMRGHDYYYCRKWHGHDWRPGSWFRVEIINHGEGWSWGLATFTDGTKGGGGSGAGDNAWAQSLWDGPAFIGINTNSLIMEQPQWPYRREEFSKLIKVGRWMVPTRFQLTDKGNEERVENYYIKKIEFLPTPDTNWFEQVLQKYSDQKSDLRSKDLGEPGVAPGKRK
ncbi:MAG: hypothetical protein P4N60_23505 [Verrucomicrobiae bacterium]|nr:hypothetical protein [Verrucomicrobiae bacterium]